MIAVKKKSILEYDLYYLIENVQEKSYDDMEINYCDCLDPLAEINQFEIFSEKNTQAQSTQLDILLSKYKYSGDILWNKIMSSSASENEHK